MVPIPRVPATSLHAVSLRAFPSPSPRIIFGIDAWFPACCPFLIVTVSGPSTLRTCTAVNTLTLRVALVLDDSAISTRALTSRRARRFNEKRGNRPMGEVSEYSYDVDPAPASHLSWIPGSVSVVSMDPLCDSGSGTR